VSTAYFFVQNGVLVHPHEWTSIKPTYAARDNQNVCVSGAEGGICETFLSIALVLRAAYLRECEAGEKGRSCRIPVTTGVGTEINSARCVPGMLETSNLKSMRLPGRQKGSTRLDCR
jgi:hypothetical protein